MLLARFIHERPSEIRADLQRYYGLNLDDMGTVFSALHAGACASCLPLGSATLASYKPEARWDNKDYSLHAIINLLSRDRVPFPWESESETESATVSKFDTQAVPIEQFNEIYYNTEWSDDGFECI